MSIYKKIHRSLFDIKPSKNSSWYFFAFIILITITINYLGNEVYEYLKYDRLKIESGEFWRLISGHFVHLNLTHLALNYAGLTIVWLLVGRYYSSFQWLVIFSISLLITSAGFWYLDKNMLWYVGLSGVIYGLLFAGAGRGIKNLPIESSFVIVVVIIKIAYEQLIGPTPDSENISGGNVVVNAHLYGSIGGLIAWLLMWRSPTT